jgi:Domain of Unknown Function (DUF1080)
MACAVLLSAGPVLPAKQSQLPAGFSAIFNGRNLDGWHPSRTTHHGSVGNFYVENGVLLASQRPFGQGGLLLTDRIYRDFELYLELKPDANFNSGVFLRSTESGSGYQIEINTPGDATANLIGERMRLSQPQYIGEKIPVSTVWKEGDWNSMRIRMEGEAPHVTTWVNDTKLYELRMPKNDQIGGIYGGMIGLQLHYTSTYTAATQSGTWSGINTRPWQLQRFRNIGIKELK